jgi:ribosomal protein S18 acetylase RimI-like enzyme
MQEPLTLRPICMDDDAFLFRLFCSTHEQNFASLDMPEEQKDDLLRMQFTAQQSQYRGQYPNADFDLVLQDAVPIGSITALRGADKFVLIDITLLREHRNAGIGTQLVTLLIQQALAAGKPLDAHVERNNPAWRLWRRLGFEVVDDDGVYLRIRVPAG